MIRKTSTRTLALWLALTITAAPWAAPLGDPDYDRAMDLLDDREYRQAFDTFQRYIDQNGNRTDAALYWQARAMSKLGRNDLAIERLNRLMAEHPGSTWHDDAEALLVELRGDTADPGAYEDENLKILALQSLMRQDPERGLPTVRRLIETSQSEQIREQGMFLLAQSDTPAARQALQDYARDSNRPRLARAAVRQIGIFGGPAARETLYTLYDETEDRAMREAILESFMIHGDRQKLLEIATSDADTELRIRAIHMLGASGAVREVESLYTADASPRVKEAVINAYMVAGETGKLLEVAKEDPDPSVREQAVSLLGAAGGTAELDELYRSNDDPTVRRSLLSALMVAGDEQRLLRIAREDEDPQIRRGAIEMLGVMGAEDALSTLRRENPTPEVIEAVMTAMMVAGDARGLIEIYEQSDDREVRLRAVQQLSMMDSEEAMQFMLQILEEE
jgi:HEAT repeat protein